MDSANDNAADLLVGANAISAYLGISRRQTYHLVHTGLAPCFKLGGSVAARKSTLTSWLADQERRVA